jgi:3-phenylpropionate/trans-cinnamate dioxygenase ferredoxin subunit/ethylbenzene dioxygenase ferredoxin subunit
MTTLPDQDLHSFLVTTLDALPAGDVIRVTPPGQPPIAVFHTDEGVFAIDDTCTHQETSLADGWVEGCAVECPLHEACFDLRTGLPSGPPAKVAVRTHRTVVDNGHIYLQLSPPTAA